MRQVRVTYHREDGSWWAESDGVAGFTAAADTLAELRALTADGMAFYLDEPVALDESLENGARITGFWSVHQFTGVPTPHVATTSGVAELPPARRRGPVPEPATA